MRISVRTGAKWLLLIGFIACLGVDWIEPRPESKETRRAPLRNDDSAGASAENTPSPDAIAEARRPSDAQRTGKSPDARQDHASGPERAAEAPSIANSPSHADPKDVPASGPALRRVLEAAIEEAREVGPLMVQAAVLDRIVETGEVRIIFPTEGSHLDPTFQRALEAAPDESGQLRVFPLFQHAAARVDSIALLALVESGSTHRIELDAIHRPSLVSSLPVISADLAHAAGFDGDGQVVAVLDTGVDATHPMFSERLVEEACFSLLGDCPNDANVMIGAGSAIPCTGSGCGHGTSVTGIVLGREPGDALLGVAPNASLIAIQIFSDIGDSIGAYSSDILGGLQHVLALSPSYDIAAVNLSIGGDLYETAGECDANAGSQVTAVATLRAVGIVVVAAAGNDGRIDRVASPGCLSNTIAVGAVRDDDSLTGFTNSSPLVTVMAPGQSIETSARGGGTTFASGTSMAAPHVAGAIAAIREAHPTATPAEIENAIALSGTPIFDARNGTTTPRLDVEATIDMLTAIGPNPPPPPPSSGGGSSTSGAGAAATPASGGGGGACGLIGIEPFLAGAMIRVARRRRSPGRIGPFRRPAS